MRTRLTRARRAAPGQEGFALPATLSVMAVLSVLAAAFAFEGRAESRIAAYAMSQSQAFYTARAGVQAAAAAVREHSRDPYHSLTADWFSSRAAYERVPFGETAYSVVRREAGGTRRAFGLDDEESRVNVNLATPEMLMRLPGMSNVLAEAVAAFVAEKKAAEDARRDRLGLERETPLDKDRPVTGPVRDLGELLAVPGVTRELLYGREGGQAPDKPGLAAALTCYSSGKVNVNTASPLALAALGLGRRQIKAVLELRATGFPGFREVSEFNGVLAASARENAGASFESPDQAGAGGPAEAAGPPGLARRPEAIDAADVADAMGALDAPGGPDAPGVQDAADTASAAPPANMLDVKSRNFRITAQAFDGRGEPRQTIRARLSLGEDAMRFTSFAAEPESPKTPSATGGRS